MSLIYLLHGLIGRCMKTIYLYTPDLMADWEAGYLLQAVHQQKMFGEPAFQVKTVGASRDPITTLGGMTILPDISLEDVSMADAAALLLPGGGEWDVQKQKSVLILAATFLENHILVGALCGATIALANVGLLDTRKHTSNSADCLTMFSETYKGAALYEDKKAVYDQDLVTASGAGGLDWARLIVERLEMFSPKIIPAWYSYYATGDAKYLMEIFRFAGM